MSKINEKPGKVSFGTAFKDYWRGYVDFVGQTTRAGYWWMQLIITLWNVALFGMIMVGIVIVSSRYAENGTDPFEGAGFLIFSIIILIISALALFLPNLALEVRRYRDAGLRGRGFLVIYGIRILIQIFGAFVLFTAVLAQGSDPETIGQQLFTNYIRSFSAVTGYVFDIFFFVVSVLATNTMTVQESSSSFMKFFFRTRETSANDDVKQVEE